MKLPLRQRRASLCGKEKKDNDEGQQSWLMGRCGCLTFSADLIHSRSRRILGSEGVKKGRLRQKMCDRCRILYEVECIWTAK
ncbi:hypothetical protein AVEN_233569-1, partial [Araneus ventricosus]